MTKFVKSEFQGSEYVTYQGRFVARFKYNRGRKGTFITFLCKNFTVEEYFERLDAGVPPLTILESKGYIDPRTGKLLKGLGFAPTVEGKAQYIMSLTNKTKVA